MMILPIIMPKNNILTDARVPFSGALTQKLINILYNNYLKHGAEFSLDLPDLYKLLNVGNQTLTRKHIKVALKQLQYPIEVRNYTDLKGKEVLWMSCAFLTRTKIKKNFKEKMFFTIDKELVHALKQKEHYTIIDIQVINKFKSKFGIVLYEMYLRYKDMKKKNIQKNMTYQTFTIDELNKKFHTKHKYQAHMIRAIKAGIDEILKITDIEIFYFWDKYEKQFEFHWFKEEKKAEFETDYYAFLKYIRTSCVDDFLIHFENKTVSYRIACDEFGKLYDIDNPKKKILAKNSKIIWLYMFEHQNQMLVLKQSRFEF
jgi:hypothetical protein